MKPSSPSKQGKSIECESSTCPLFPVRFHFTSLPVNFINVVRSVFHLAMEDHEMQVIEVDGIEVAPYTVDELSVSAAQRYSLLIEAKNQTDKNYAFMAYQNTDM